MSTKRIDPAQAAIDGALGRLREKQKRMTTAKARRLIDAIAACVECEDIEDGDRVALDDARAAIERFDKSF